MSIAAIVAGGTRGIGLAIAERLVAEGADVLVSSRAAVEAKDVAKRLTRQGPGRAYGIACDVRDPQQCTELVSGAVRTHGRLDVVSRVEIRPTQPKK